MDNDIINWIENNNINCTHSGAVIVIEDFAKMLFVKDKDGIIINKDFSLNLSDEEYDFLDENKDIEHIVFKFGNRYYFCAIKNKKKNDYNEEVIKPEFNDFRNLGNHKTDFKEYKYCSLGVHSGYELLNGSGECDNWAKKAKYFKFEALGICEKNTLAGSLAFQLACNKNGLKAIIGQTISVAYNYDPEKEFQNVYDIKVFVKNETGWRNMLRISKMINIDYGEFIPQENLLQFTEGLIFVFSRDSFFYHSLNNRRDFLTDLEIYKTHIDKSDLYFQIDLTEFADDNYDLENIKNIKKYFDGFSKYIKPIYIQDAYYVEKIDSSVKVILNKIDRKASVESDDQYLKSVDEIIQQNSHLFDNNDEALGLFIDSLQNTNEIASKCDFKIEIGHSKLPKYPKKNKEAFYHELIAKGFEEKIYNKYKGDDEKIAMYLDRVDTENEIIVQGDLIDYFLILWDIIDWCKRNDILVGPGRGSAGGSLVAYLLGIIEIDPITYNLLFERFLNKTRVLPEVIYDLTMEDGSVISVSEGDSVPLTNGKMKEINSKLDLIKIDIDVEKMKAK